MRTRTHIERFRHLEHGAILPFWGVSLTVLLGMVALSFDLGRIGITQTELQSFADSVALAAAGELDGQDDAIARATAAASAMITDRQTFGDGGHMLSGSSDYTLTFLSTLPAADFDTVTGLDVAIPSTAETTDPADAIYVEVEVAARTVSLSFAGAFAALTGTSTIANVVSARAVAGFTSYACDVTPLMFCAPSGWSADDHIGSMIMLRSGGSGEGAWAAGDFGFVDPSKVLTDSEGPCAGLSGGNLDRCLLGAAGPITQCFSYRGIDIEPGQKVGNYEAALNTRFDLYRATMNSAKSDPDFAPAPNVIKGIVPNGGGACIGNNVELSPNTMGQPRDTCFGDGTTANTCDDVNGGNGSRFGDGSWNRSAYYATNYAPFDGSVPADMQTWFDDHGTTAATATRYQVYLAEIARAGDILTGDASGDGADGEAIAESGRPICNTETNPSVDANRRVIIAAGIDCASYGIGGAASGVPVEEYVKIFLTEPASDDGSGNSFTIWGEVAGTAGGGAGSGGTDGAIFHDVVQLYR